VSGKSNVGVRSIKSFRPVGRENTDGLAARGIFGGGLTELRVGEMWW
jgi:hypothetical protein